MSVKPPADPRALAAAAERALELVRDGARLGLGSGRAATVFIGLLGDRVRAGLRVAAVATSAASARRAREVGVPLVDLAEDVELDLTVDGADEVSPELDLVKGWGGALVNERIVAAASRRQVIVVGPEKLVPALGERGRIPVEIVPLACGPAMRCLHALGLRVRLEAGVDGRPVRTENCNVTLDAAPDGPLDGHAARALETAIRAIPGVVDVGLFLGTAERVIVGHPDGSVDVLRRPETR